VSDDEKKETEVDLGWVAVGGQQWLLYSADHSKIHGGVVQVGNIYPPQCFLVFAPPNRCELLFPGNWVQACERVEAWRAENAAEYEQRKQLYKTAGVPEDLRVEQIERVFLSDRGRDGSNR